MYVIKRDGRQEPVRFDKITARLKKLSYGLSNDHCDPVLVAQKVCAGVYRGVTTTQLDELAAETAASMTANHPDYALLAARISVSRLHKNTKKPFSETIKLMYNNLNKGSGQKAPLIADDVYEIIMKNAERLDSEILYDRDFEYDYFGFKTLERSYLLKVDGKIVERPQHLLMRVAVGIHKDDIESATKTYHLMSQSWFTHATPTLFNAGTAQPQLSSCFLLCMKDDSIEGIYDTLKECAVISKLAGGIGIAVHNIHATGSYIRGTNGTSNGIVPMLRVFNNTARYVDQGGGKRKGAFAIYLEPWHADIFEFLDLRKNHGKEEHRARDLFLALWIPDLFMERVRGDDKWSLFCPSEAPGLADCWGQEFEKLYTQYEREDRAKKIISSRKLWFEILNSQIETGTPYMLFKDSCNRKSNQQNLGTIKSSNLCTEVIEFTSPTETAVCNLASVALPRFVMERGVPAESQSSKMVGSRESKNKYFDFEKLAEVTTTITANLNKIIDVNYYPVETARRSNLRHRPIGIGVQGLADTFILLGMPFDSSEAKRLNKDIFETIYYHALRSSSELAAKDGPYETYCGSPVSKGILQMDMWGVTPSDRWDWDALREMISKSGVRNSLLIAPMPTASTSQILGNNECFEPYTSNIYSRRVLSGEFVVMNKHLLHDLTEMGLWSPVLKNKIINENGSVSKIPEIPEQLKAIYKTVWEIKQKTLVDMAADRGCYIDQSQSLNIHMEQPDLGKLTSLHFHAWSKGLKTGMYYLRTRAAADAIKFTVDTTVLNNENISPCPTASPDLILMELKQAKLNLGKTINDLGVIQTSVESLNKKMKKEKTLLKKTRERLTSKFAGGLSLEEELKQARTKPHIADDVETDYKAGYLMKMDEVQKTEVLKGMLAENIKTNIRTAELRLLAAKKMEEAARAAEAVALAEIKALSTDESSSGYALPEPEKVPSFEARSPLNPKDQKAEELSQKKVETLKLPKQEVHFTKMSILNKLREATEEVKLSKQALEEALNKVEMANRKQVAVEEAIRKWMPEDDQVGQDAYYHTRLGNFHLHPSDQRQDSPLNEVNNPNLIGDGPKPVLRTTVSMRDVLSRKQIRAEEYVAARPAEGGTERQKVALSQMLHELREDLTFHPRVEKHGGEQKQQFYTQRRKFGFIHISLPMTKPGKKKMQDLNNMKMH